MAEALIQATISRLGYIENGVYHQEPDCFDGVRDLIRFMANDDSSFTVRKTCMKHNVVSQDLVPIMRDPKTTDELFDASLRLAVNLCQPTTMVLSADRSDDDDKGKKMMLYNTFESGLLRLLSAFNDAKLFEVLKTKMEEFFNLGLDDRTEKKKVLIERIIVLLRYVLSIGYHTATFVRVNNVDSTVQEAVIRCFLKSSIPSVFFKVITSKADREFCLHFLGIFATVVMPFNATKVASTGSASGKALTADIKKREDQRTISNMMVQSLAQNRPRSSRPFLGGTYVMKGLTPTAKNNGLVLTKPLMENKPLASFANRKVATRVAKNKRITDFTENALQTGQDARPETLATLHTFMEELIKSSYGRLMKTCRDLAFGTRSATHQYAEIHFFQLVEFVMEYARVSKVDLKYVHFTFSKEFFHTVLSQLETYFDMIKTDKQNHKMYTLKAQHTVSAYKQLLMYLNYLSTVHSEDGEAQEVYQEMCKHLFEIPEYREMGYTIMSGISPSSSTRKLLEELVIANHFYLHVMEREVKAGELRQVLKKKRVVKERAKKGTRKNDDPEESPYHADVKAFLKKVPDYELDGIWTEIVDDLADVLQSEGGIDYADPCMLNVDELSEDSQKGCRFLFIQRALRERRLADAVGLYHQARLYWNDGTFGNDDMSAEEEFVDLQQIFYADLEDFAEEYSKIVTDLYGPAEGNPAEDKDEEEDENEVEEEKRERRNVTVAVSFNLDEYLSSYARSDVMSWCIFLLKGYKTNSFELNKALVKLFHRIAFDLKSPARLYNMHIHFDLYQFGHHLLKQFFGHFMERGPIMMNEILFAKTGKECYEIEHGYGTHDGDKNKDILWPEELEEEVKNLYNEYTDFEEKPDDLDVVDFIESNMARERTRKQIIKKLKDLGLSYTAKKKATSSRKHMLSDLASQLLEGLAQDFNELPEDARGDGDVIDYIRQRLPEDYSRQKIVKELAHRGIPYFKPKKASKRKSTVAKKESSPESAHSDSEADEPENGEVDEPEAKRMRVGSDSEEEASTPAFEKDDSDVDMDEDHPIGKKRRTVIVDSDEEDDLTTMDTSNIATTDNGEREDEGNLKILSDSEGE
uniref:TIMELESS domain-containing protein n=1 Tax=Panagrellus redivivus TaxID=6233 RepID=A0A7E4W433_PANRE